MNLSIQYHRLQIPVGLCNTYGPAARHVSSVNSKYPSFLPSVLFNMTGYCSGVVIIVAHSEVETLFFRCGCNFRQRYLFQVQSTNIVLTQSNKRAQRKYNYMYAQKASQELEKGCQMGQRSQMGTSGGSAEPNLTPLSAFICDLICWHPLSCISARLVRLANCNSRAVGRQKVTYHKVVIHC